MKNSPTLAPWRMEKAMEVKDVGALRGLRDQADELLSRLKASRTRSEQRLLETGQRDPMRFVTGRSALESAIDSTRGMIEQMDALLTELAHEIEHAEADERAARAQQEPAAIGSGA